MVNETEEQIKSECESCGCDESQLSECNECGEECCQGCMKGDYCNSCCFWAILIEEER